jgi:ATP-dependent DNA helicase RecG
MKDFNSGSIQILVATTLIEVGIDVPAANVMVIQSSESFGLAQLHQLRGRIGRGSKPAYCYLVHSNNQSPSKRLRTMESCSDGFKLAEIDLELRGPGAIYGSFQHGALDLRLAELSDKELLKKAREAVQYFLDTGLDLLQYKRLADSVGNLQKITNLN